MSFSDPKAQELGMKGFFDPASVESVIRCVRHDHGDRLFRSTRGETDSVARELHAKILSMNDLITPFHNVPQILGYALMLRDALSEDEHASADLLLSHLEGCTGYIIEQRLKTRLAEYETASAT